MSARQMFIQDPASNRIRLTKAGVDRYATRFARVGFQVSEIRTLDQLRNAIDASFDHEMAQLASTTRGSNTDLDEIMSGLSGWD
ncbi:MAG: hypothetical protein KZQ85_10845 [Candidatus Thiodiazotropha sp. (ex Myrtea sp. 'scaly one' KF741663)]|nr:hypothetical protein [Candidatus Thiodiazotropha sp. (ex Myrtea sp. 'scaly one' KF741663)]